MEFKQSLSRRIVIVFALMSAFVAGVFAVGIVATVHLVERKLTTMSLSGNMHRLLLVDNADDWRHRPEKDELFYIDGGDGDLSMPDELKTLPVGFQELTLGPRTYYAMVAQVDGRQYVLLRDQEGMEQRAHVLFIVVGAGFLLSIAMAILLGGLLARRVMAPVVRLARQVRHRDKMLGLAPPLSPDYTDDEVGELARSFDETLSKLRAALNREQMFTSDVSHELRTPLMILASSCDLLLGSELDERSQRQVTRIARATDGMSQLVETFLLLARDREAASHGNPTATLRRTADELVEIWGRQIEAKGLEFIYVVDNHSSEVYNQAFLHSVMGNLLRNAWHYTDTGFVRLTLTQTGFHVEDSGIGIPEEKRNAMFQPFVRGDEQRGEGLGLGLSLVQRICVNQGWSVSLSSREPHGCLFSVKLGDA
ncbi:MULTISPECIES: sensor histidine kinase [Pseudomonas]|jgi:signal transduction histidine kinase|uniref:histidine kinase n=1 Tax=Pseudomonas coleopterorum TaxID=1605838 RepID=A0AAJ6M435_9PSED|nr:MULTISPECIES: HAMP domain-containing sensor histidine kinase [Pseudomonas]KNC16855.1 histidine kinase [Pseudomonas sp. RIT-PI-a]WNC11841.1 HAMP domain-containing sensor histidine kinase [Pseudomonas coleopterorum]